MTEVLNYSLDEKYTKEEGRIILSGIQALVRLPLDQHRADKRAGLNTASFISGYRGSPLGGYDFALKRDEKLLEEHQVKFMPGVNEDLGAMAVFGSQIANTLPNPKYDGVLGIWYGKAPGVDRSGDIFKHANFAGVGKNGGVLVLAGDDPSAKSSTIPSHSEVALFDAQIPILYPGNIQEILEFGRYGFELSRYSGLWVSMKIVTDVADSYGTANVSIIDNIQTPDFVFNGKPWQHSQSGTLLPQIAKSIEKEMYLGRFKAVDLFAQNNPLNQITVSSKTDKFGIISAGKTYYDVLEILDILELTEKQLNSAGIRILKLGLISPLEPKILEKFAQGLDQILIIEEKRGLIEMLVRNSLFNLPNHPKIIGKNDENGNELVPSYGELTVDDLIEILQTQLAKYIPEIANQPSKASPLSLDLPIITEIDMVARTPYFCSGCPHNRSTNLPENSIAFGGIGCHALALLMNRENTGLMHMGGEGVQFVGASEFTDTNHVFQNIGDGTLFHSGSLAIRQAIAAKTNITYKILYNDAVAMTGGQPADGSMSVPELTVSLAAEGVVKTIVCADDPKKYGKRVNWAKNSKVWHRDKLDKAQEILRDIQGVTVLIYDQPCAADIRRKRKRGQAPTPKRQIFINEAVCEGCGDCGVKSNCLSVFPVETEFGRKTQIHQSSCNRDYTCVKGDCPAFVSIRVKESKSKPLRPVINIHENLPEPKLKIRNNANIFMTGIGGTGVVTVTQILSTAALLDSKMSINLDQTGLSQKGGPVVSHLKFSKNGKIKQSNRVANGQADTFLVFDILSGSTDANLIKAHPERTIAIISDAQIPTGSMVRSNEVLFPENAYLKSRIDAVSREEDNVNLNSVYLAENIFNNYLFANMITVGAAYQAGALPLSKASIHKAIELNGVAIEDNKLAFNVGRMYVHNSEEFESINDNRVGAQEITSVITPQAEQLLGDVEIDSSVYHKFELRVNELIAYQNKKYAKSYIDYILKVFEKEKSLKLSNFDLTKAVIQYLFKLMAYKDEYEVARLYLKPEFTEAVIAQFGDEYKLGYYLHPPMLRTLGWKNKIEFGTWFRFGYRVLHKMRRLRGTIFDIFGYARVRRTERKLIKEYKSMIDRRLENLDRKNLETTIKLALLPDMIRGYEHVKLGNVEVYRTEVEKLIA